MSLSLSGGPVVKTSLSIAGAAGLILGQGAKSGFSCGTEKLSRSNVETNSVKTKKSF